MEVVDKDVEPPECDVEEVDDGEKDATVEQEVSTDCLSRYTTTTHCMLLE